MSTDLRVLLVEDSPDDANLVLRTLRREGFVPDFLRVETAEAMSAALDEGGWEIILSDYHLPRFSGPEALELLKEKGLDVPFVIVSGTVGEKAAIECMRAGARDYLLKGNLSRLAAALQRELRAAQDRRRQREEELRSAEIELAREQAERENRFKSQFLAQMSHELRTPLNSIIGFSELLERETAGPLLPVQKEYLELVLTSSRHLLRLIEDVLDLSKVSVGAADLRLESTSLETLVESVVSGLKPLVSRGRVTLDSAVASGLPELRVDPLRLKQILYNLLANGIKFTPAGGGVALRAQPEGDRCRIDVSDTGIGIRREDLPLLFREFQRLAPQDGVQREGTGLGLALTKRLVELHGGELSVESEPGRGSTFTVRLPW
jgi:signal transduction histidine kinase